MIEQDVSLTYVNHFKIADKVEGLNEPSGLALSYEGDALWTISDDTKKIFKLSFDGGLRKDEIFQISDKELEGIALDPTGEFLFAVKEETNEIIKIKISTQKVVDRRRLAEMSSYDSIAHYFDSSGANKGLEGITYHSEGTIFVIKEGIPGLLIEVSSELTAVRSHQRLSSENGFFDVKVAEEKLDFSGICYDQTRDYFWIISDKAKRLFLYNWNINKVIKSFKLGYEKNGKYRKIKKVEGVAIDSKANHLYLVSDKEARLYIFDINIPQQSF